MMPAGGAVPKWGHRRDGIMSGLPTSRTRPLRLGWTPPPRPIHKWRTPSSKGEHACTPASTGPRSGFTAHPPSPDPPTPAAAVGPRHCKGPVSGAPPGVLLQTARQCLPFNPLPPLDFRATRTPLPYAALCPGDCRARRCALRMAGVNRQRCVRATASRRERVPCGREAPPKKGQPCVVPPPLGASGSLLHRCKCPQAGWCLGCRFDPN